MTRIWVSYTSTANQKIMGPPIVPNMVMKRRYVVTDHAGQYGCIMYLWPCPKAHASHFDVHDSAGKPLPVAQQESKRFVQRCNVGVPEHIKT